MRQISDHQDQINDLRVELASIREQKNSAMKEVIQRLKLIKLMEKFKFC
jgi:hypothetical protein